MAVPSAFERPSELTLQLLLRAIAPWQKLTSPKFTGLQQVPHERPLLFVGNHTLFGVIDVPLLFAKLYVERGIYLRALGDHGHFKIPVWGALLQQLGAVDGTREICAELMRAGEPILVFPGGAREVAKRKGELYKLIWSERVGFARMAIQHGCTIVPFAALGAEDMFEIQVDGNDLMASPLGAIARGIGMRQDFLPPLVTPQRKLERFYFHFGQAIETRSYGGTDSDDAAREVRDRTRVAIETGLQTLVREREHDPERYLASRVAQRVYDGLALARGKR